MLCKRLQTLESFGFLNPEEESIFCESAYLVGINFNWSLNLIKKHGHFKVFQVEKFLEFLCQFNFFVSSFFSVSMQN